MFLRRARGTGPCFRTGLTELGCGVRDGLCFTQRRRGKEGERQERVCWFLEERDYKLRGATKSFANATQKASRVSPRLIECEESLDSPFGAESAAVFNHETHASRFAAHGR